MIKAFMFDLDGTIIDDQYKMSNKTIECLKKLKEKGYILAVNSGRPVFLCDLVIDEPLGKDFFDYIYGNNGGELYNKKTKEKKYLKLLNPKELYEMMNLYNTDLFTLGVYSEDGTNSFYMPKDSSLEGLDHFLEVRGLKKAIIDFKDNTVSYPKILLLHEKERYKETIEFIKNNQRDFADVYHSGRIVVEIVPKDISKKYAVDHLCKLENIKPDEVMVFGDSENDLPMLTYANGVVMGGANDDIKALVKTKTLSVEDDGVYYYLKENGYLD